MYAGLTHPIAQYQLLPHHLQSHKTHTRPIVVSQPQLRQRMFPRFHFNLQAIRVNKSSALLRWNELQGHSSSVSEVGYNVEMICKNPTGAVIEQNAYTTINNCHVINNLDASQCFSVRVRSKINPEIFSDWIGIPVYKSKFSYL